MEMDEVKAAKESFLPERNRDYLELEYWNERFAKEEEYEWFKGYSEFRDLILKCVKTTDKVLQVGSGNSLLSQHMHADGITNILSTDLSPVVVERMRARTEREGLEGLRWEVADMLSLPFPDGSFDVVIEKGAMDVLFVDSDSPWDPSTEVRKRVSAMLEETHRVLSPTGLFISISFAQPHFRRPLLEFLGSTWTMEYSTFGDAFHYFFYTLQKGTRSVSTCGRSQDHGDDAEDHQRPRSYDLEHENMDSEDYLLQIDVS